MNKGKKFTSFCELGAFLGRKESCRIGKGDYGIVRNKKSAKKEAAFCRDFDYEDERPGSTLADDLINDMRGRLGYSRPAQGVFVAAGGHKRVYSL